MELLPLISTPLEVTMSRMDFVWGNAMFMQVSELFDV
jgi:hypothetical protein